MKINSENIAEFKELYEKAVKEENEGFVFHGQEVFVGYAKYVIEHHEIVK